MTGRGKDADAIQTIRAFEQLYEAYEQRLDRGGPRLSERDWYDLRESHTQARQAEDWLEWYFAANPPMLGAMTEVPDPVAAWPAVEVRLRRHESEPAADEEKPRPGDAPSAPRRLEDLGPAERRRLRADLKSWSATGEPTKVEIGAKYGISWRQIKNALLQLSNRARD